MSKVFVRERRRIGQGAGRPRFAIVAVQGADLKVFRTRVRRGELEKIASEASMDVPNMVGNPIPPKKGQILDLLKDFY